MEWDLFNERIQLIPASTVDQAGPLPAFLEPDYNILEWQNFLKNPELPTMATLLAPPTPLVRWTHALRWPSLVGVAVLIAWCLGGILRKSGDLRRRIALTCVAVVACTASFWFGREANLSADVAGRIVNGLLHNI